MDSKLIDAALVDADHLASSAMALILAINTFHGAQDREAAAPTAINVRDRERAQAVFSECFHAVRVTVHEYRKRVQRYRDSLRLQPATPADQHTAGLYRKFDVRRTDGRDLPGGDREGATYFVLDVTHDPHAKPALAAYAAACMADYPQLAGDLVRQYGLEVAETPASDWALIKTSEAGRKYVADFFCNTLQRHDFTRYINERLAADFACVLANALRGIQAARAKPAPQRVAVPEGWQLVPKEPTREMLGRFGLSAELALDIYRTVLSVAAQHDGVGDVPVPRELLDNVLIELDEGGPYSQEHAKQLRALLAKGAKP